MKFLEPLENVDGIERVTPREGYVECPHCKGYGYWNLQVDAYGPGRHFKAFCGQCLGNGQVKAGTKDAACVHQFTHVRRLRNCLNEYECVKCGQRREVDSGD